jgi:hypothetical protein
VPVFGLGAERRGDLDFDLAIGCFRKSRCS